MAQLAEDGAFVGRSWLTTASIVTGGGFGLAAGAADIGIGIYNGEIRTLVTGGLVTVGLGLATHGLSKAYTAARAGGVAAERTVPRVTANRLDGNAFRDEIAGLLKAEGREVTTEVYKSTPFGKRFIDIEVSKDGQFLGGIETKFGGSRYTPAQSAKDWWLKANDGFVNVVRNK